MNAAQRRIKLRARRSAITVGATVYYKRGWTQLIVTGKDPKDSSRVYVMPPAYGGIERSVPLLTLTLVCP